MAVVRARAAMDSNGYRRLGLPQYTSILGQRGAVLGAKGDSQGSGIECLALQLRAGSSSG
jgi:hypothetical protein